MSDNDSVVSKASNMKNGRFCKCKRRLTTIDLHIDCERCRPFTCNMDNRCTTCASWSSTHMKKFLKRMDILHRERIFREFESMGGMSRSGHVTIHPSISTSNPAPQPQVAFVKRPISGTASRNVQKKGKIKPVSSAVSSLHESNLDNKLICLETKIDKKFEEQRAMDRVERQSEREGLLKLVSDSIRQAFNPVSSQVAAPELVQVSSVAKEGNTENPPPGNSPSTLAASALNREGTVPAVTPTSHLASQLSLGGGRQGLM